MIHIRVIQKIMTDWECPVCLDNTETPMVNPACGHTFCSKCVHKIQQCALCRSPISAPVVNYALLDPEEKKDDEDRTFASLSCDIAKYYQRTVNDEIPDAIYNMCFKNMRKLAAGSILHVNADQLDSGLALMFNGKFYIIMDSVKKQSSGTHFQFKECDDHYCCVSVCFRI